MGEGGTRRGEWAPLSVDGHGHDHAQPSELLQRSPLLIRHQPHARILSDVRGWGLSVHESGGIVCGERVWTL